MMSEAAQIIKVSPDDPTKIIDEKLAYPVRLLSEGNVVAIPTETVYGLAANALSSKAVEGIFYAKGRPRDNPLIVHISDMNMLYDIVEPCLVKIYAQLMEKFWPGPITFLLPKSKIIPDIVTAGQSTVAIRMPSHPIARRIIELCNFPLAAPSANLSGHTSPTLASHVFHDLGDRIPCIVDSGACKSGVESTVLTLLHDPPKILRPGGITFEMLAPLVPNLTVHYSKYYEPSHSRTMNMVSEVQYMEEPLSPGMKYIHYSPKAKLVLLQSESLGQEQIKDLENFISNPYISNGKRIKLGCLLTKYDRILNKHHSNMISLYLGQEKGQLDEIAKDLFAGMRSLDSHNVDVILIEALPLVKEGLAIMNRLSKAASLVLPSSVTLSMGLKDLMHVQEE